MAVNLVNSPSYVMQQNTCSILILLPESDIVFLPQLSAQLETIKFINISGGTVLINLNDADTGALFFTLVSNNYVEIYPNKISVPLVWLILGSGSIQGTTVSWNTIGNILTSAGKIGSTNNIDFDIVRNDLPQLSFPNTGITLETNINMNDQFAINCKDPSAPGDVANQRYVDNAITPIGLDRYTNLIGSLVDSVISPAVTTITLSAPLNKTFRIVVNTFILNFTNYGTTDIFMGPPPSAYNNNSPYYCFGSNTLAINSAPTVAIAFISRAPGATSITFTATLLGATGYSIYIYN